MRAIPLRVGMARITEGRLVFHVNDTIMYDNIGVCKVEDIRPEKFGQEEVLYYVLKPVVDDRSVIFCPVNSDKLKLRELLSVQEVNALIDIMPDTEAEWIDNDKLRRETFQKTLKAGRPQELVKLIKTLYIHREQKKQEGKKFHTVDEKIMTQAEYMLYGEIAHVLNIKQEKVVEFIADKLDGSGGATDAQPR